MTPQLFNHDVTKNFAVIALLILLIVSSGAMIYFSSPPPNNDIPIKNTPTPTPNLPTPQILSPTSTPAAVERPTPTGTLNPATSATPIPAPQKGLLDDLSSQQKIEHYATFHSANGNWSSEFQIAPQTWTGGEKVRFAATLNFSDELFDNYKLTYPTDDQCLPTYYSRAGF